MRKGSLPADSATRPVVVQHGIKGQPPGAFASCSTSVAIQHFVESSDPLLKRNAAQEALMSL